MSNPAKNVRFAEKLQTMQEKVAPDQVTVMQDRTRDQELQRNAPRTPGVQDEQFPTEDLSMADPRDKVQYAKLELQDPDHPGYTKFGKLEAKDSDFEWLQKKQAALEAADFDEWFARWFDLMDPAQKKRAKELYPEFYARRKKLLKKQSRNAFDFARIKLEGIETFDDLVKTYMAETGRLDLGPMQRLMQPELGFKEKDNTKRFQRGLANPFLIFGKEAIPANYKQRQVEQQMFAARTYAPEDSYAKLGLRSGVDPLDTNSARGGDAAWYKQLLGRRGV